ncbi:MAG: hypothetical protein QM702_13070 [Rubrivivax sp.]
MLPTRQQWNDWSPAERAAYVAQVAAALALLPTVLFAWLGWREARLAREDQAKYFAAEKSPRAEVSRVYNRDGWVIAELTNRGDSIARNVEIEMSVTRPDGTILLGGRDSQPPANTLLKGESARSILLGTEALAEQLTFAPREYEARRLARDGEVTGTLHLTLHYQDAVDNDYSPTFSFTATK